MVKMDLEKGLDAIRKAFIQFEKENSAEFEKERKKEFVTESGQPIRRIYTPCDLADKEFDYLKDLGFPGEYPFTRGINPIMYRGDHWQFSKYGGETTPEASNQLWKAQIEAGINQIAIAYDLPSQMGYDPDHPMAKGEVGRVGVSMVSQQDWEVAFDGIDLKLIDLHSAYNAPAVIHLANHICLAEKRGIPQWDIGGTIQNDIFKEYIARGCYIFPIKESLRLTVDLICYTINYMPNYRPITICMGHYPGRGANSVQEVAIGLITAFTYLDEVINRGQNIDSIAPKIWFHTSSNHSKFFEEIAKLRAFRWIWARALKERFKAQKSESMMAKWLCSSRGSGLTREQYLNNITRNTIACLAAVLAGSQGIDLRSYDEAFGIPTREASINTLRTQAVIALETDIPNTVDPLAGSYFIESLTSEMEEKILEQVEEIHRIGGGVIPAIESGYIQSMLNESAYKWHKAYERGEIPSVGVNCFRDDYEERPIRIYRANPEVEGTRKKVIQELKRKRDNIAVKRAIDEIKAVALLEPKLENSLIPPIIDAVKCYTTTGEICFALREIWGESNLP
jgi:methylmalonyl-CoA mutase N-terminal domain/subunit